MRWVDGKCRLTDGLVAGVRQSAYYGPWCAEINTYSGRLVWEFLGLASESAAKSAVAAWIGKTIAQLGNALAAGEPQVDEE